MRVLHLTNHIQNVGNGIVNVAVDLACLQATDGLEVAIASLGGEYEILLEKYGISHFELDQSRRVTKLIKAVYSYRDIIKKFQPDIVHCHMMTGVLLAGIFRNNHEYGLVATVHNEFQRSAILMGLADRVIAVSHAVANSMIRRGIPSRKLRVVANGTLGSPRHKKIQEYQPMKLHHPAITTVAGMYTRKGISELIQAFQIIAQDFTQAHLYIVGEGPDRTMFEAMVQKCGELKHRIHFEGFQPEPQRYMLSTDIFVLASHCESFGLVLTEAREAGCAIVATDVDGIPETLDYGQAGILVPPQDSQSLAYALIQLLRDRHKLQAWKLRGQQNLQRFSTTRVSEETLSIYRELSNKYNVFSPIDTRQLVTGK
ncbi:glycosyltransferase family 4 protein [Cylindrospermopsis raciborskii]|uniref:glycosyltransferase family 4 protein n=1 Tax=Cylindrospermopsis raciborskii TaxID=77022 RepID=UPI001BA891FA|nr:glycosyltransferase family 4 protein [Cylindrospermopsis raciborskii]